jgi:hypothetical protein
MQECEDYIETVELNNSLPFHHKGRDNHFAEQVRLLLGCHLTHWEDFTIQLKNITQGERTWKHKARPMELHMEWIHQDSDFVVHVG